MVDKMRETRPRWFEYSKRRNTNALVKRCERVGNDRFEER